MFLLIYFTSMILCLIAGFVIYKKAKNSPPSYGEKYGGIRLKEAIMLWLSTLGISLLPLINTLGVIVVIGSVISMAFDDNDDSKWYNKRLKNKSVQEKY